MALPLRTFVVRVYADGALTVEDVRSGERSALDAVDQLGAGLRRWLAVEGQEDEIDLRPSRSDVLVGEDETV